MQVSKSVDRKDMRPLTAKSPNPDEKKTSMPRFSELLLKHTNSLGLNTVSSAILEKRKKNYQEIQLVNQMRSLGLIKETHQTTETDSRGPTSNRITTRERTEEKDMNFMREKSKNVNITRDYFY